MRGSRLERIAAERPRRGTLVSAVSCGIVAVATARK
jgi:hypothetical protein